MSTILAQVRNAVFALPQPFLASDVSRELRHLAIARVQAAVHRLVSSGELEREQWNDPQHRARYRFRRTTLFDTTPQGRETMKAQLVIEQSAIADEILQRLATVARHRLQHPPLTH